MNELRLALNAWFGLTYLADLLETGVMGENQDHKPNR